MTVRVTVLLSAMFKEAAGKREVIQELGEGSTLKVLLDKLAHEYGKDFNQILDQNTGQVTIDALVMLNGQGVRKTDVQIKDGDVVMISVPIGGG
jgi:MoaD family protein